MSAPSGIWLYPLPPLFALAGFLFILFSRPNVLSRELIVGAIVAFSGAAIFSSSARASAASGPFRDIAKKLAPGCCFFRRKKI